MSNIKLDEIGYWSEVKLDIIKEYAKPYSTIIKAQPNIQKCLYIDGFSGAGVHISKRTNEFVLGSPLNALNVQPQFDEFHFIDLDGDKSNLLKKAVGDLQGVFVYKGDCNQILVDTVFPRAKFSDYNRALCLLDPYGIHLDWKVVETAGRMRSIEIFLNFPVMDMNMNVLWRNPERVKPEHLDRMDAFWGNRSWKDAAYIKTAGLFEDIEERRGIESLVSAYRKRLLDVAGFAFVPAPIPMRNTKGGIVYYLFFASPNKTGAKIVNEIYNKYRDKGVA